MCLSGEIKILSFFIHFRGYKVIGFPSTTVRLGLKLYTPTTAILN